MIKENEETILQSGANIRISCLLQDLFQVCEVMLETLRLCSYTYYFICLQTKQSFISIVPLYYRLSLLQTLNLPPHGVCSKRS